MPVKCDLFNPTPGARVIYDGITNRDPIRIGAGATVTGIILADHIVEMLKVSAGLGDNVDLKILTMEEMAEESEEKVKDIPQFLGGKVANKSTKSKAKAV